MNSDLVKTLEEAMETLVEETGLDADALFGERVLEPAQMSTRAAYAAGMIEGAAIALGVTALELLDEVRVALGEGAASAAGPL
jgi:hypothetical protein